MRKVLVVGAKDDLGRGICTEYQRRGWYVIALVPETAKVNSLAADQLVEADPTDPESLVGIMAGVELVMCRADANLHEAASRVTDDPSVQNLLLEARRAGVSDFDLVFSQASTKATHLNRAQPNDMTDGVSYAQHPTDQFEKSFAATGAAHVHHLNLKRKKP